MYLGSNILSAENDVSIRISEAAIDWLLTI